MKEWKQLKKEKIPEDILTEDYEIEESRGNICQAWRKCYSTPSERWGMLKHLFEGNVYRYRKPEPKQPTHEEIMTKWFKCKWQGYDDIWFKVIRYTPNPKSYWINNDESRSKQWFINCQSADIPPEE